MLNGTINENVSNVTIDEGVHNENTCESVYNGSTVNVSVTKSERVFKRVIVLRQQMYTSGV